jgi:hypothetical protein
MGVLRAVLLCIGLGWWFGFIACFVAFGLPGLGIVTEGLIFSAMFGGWFGACVGGVCAPVFAIVFRRKSFDATGAWLFLTVTPCVILLHLFLPFLAASPFSIVVFLMACAGLGAELEDECKPEGLCQNCEYNLAGNVSGICPECGTPVPGGGSDRFGDNSS